MKQILKNLISLSTSELFTKIIGVITAGYIARILNPSGYGIINFAMAFTSYFIIASTFGLDTYGNREAAKNLLIKQRLVNNILSIKTLLSFVIFIPFIIITLTTEISGLMKLVLIVTGLNIFINAGDIKWYFQAVEKMHYVASWRIINSILILGGLFLLVHSPDDIIMTAFVYIVAGGISVLLFLSIYRKLENKIKFEYDKRRWVKILKEAFPILISSLMVAIYYNMDMVMLGYMKSSTDVGIYSAAYKIFMVGIIPFTLIMHSFFPSISRTKLKATPEFKTLIKNYFIFLIVAGLISSTFLYYLKDMLIALIFGTSYNNAALPLSILAMNALVISVNIFFGNPLIAWGKQKQYSIALTVGAVSNIALNFILIPHYSFNGAAFATLISETLVFCGVLVLFTKNTIDLL